jgi:hypothetical protein
MYKGAISLEEFRTLLWASFNKNADDALEHLLGEVEDLVRRARMGTAQNGIAEAAIKPLTWDGANKQFDKVPLTEIVVDHPTSLSSGGDTTLVMERVGNNPILTEPDNVGLDILEDKTKL